MFSELMNDYQATRRVGSLTKRSVKEPIDSILNKTPKQVVKEPMEKENCNYSRNILWKRKEIARELALFSTNLGGLMSSATQFMEKLILRALSCKLGLEYREGNRGFCSIYREVGMGEFC